ncbi:prepilin-type N-terminal cleavage/methylation domain-containing protein [Glaciibacter flavus]|uniref:Prepilin-type N-terminal cleavage/methylation domain-containing protein n=2 Tax=Orlajensenia flava TaxID=2565934 RepID=A0A4V3WT30_9MICO|nr:prepilin-type N-terminal cleavage/methylation domain-containing protein [Glaciibacter flavus]
MNQTPYPRMNERGFTLIEMMISVSIFAVFVAIFIASVVGLARGTTAARVTAESSSGVLTVFQNIDRQVRWSDAINRPGTGASGSTYVEFQLPASSSADNTTRCVQYRYDPAQGIIASRIWVTGVTPLPSFSVKLTNVIPQATPNYPFTMIPAGASARQALYLDLNAGTVGISEVHMTSTFMARNSTADSITNADNNADGQSDRPVCSPTVTRP